MFSTVPMSRMTLAAPVDAMADIVRACSELGGGYIDEYTKVGGGLGVGYDTTSCEVDRGSG